MMCFVVESGLNAFLMSEIKSLQSNLTLEEIQARQAKLGDEVYFTDMSFFFFNLE